MLFNLYICVAKKKTKPSKTAEMSSFNSRVSYIHTVDCTNSLKYGTLLRSIYTFHHCSVGFAEQINHRKELHSAVSANIRELLPQQLSDPVTNRLSVCTSGLYISPSLIYTDHWPLQVPHRESTVILFTVTKATYSFDVSFSIKTKVPAESVKSSGNFELTQWVQVSVSFL